MTFFWIAVGGAFGACARYFMATSVFQWIDKPFPYGTLSVNLLGSFAIGAAFVWLNENGWGGQQSKLLIMVGFLGAFTTFSTFSLESLSLLEQSRYFEFLLYVGYSLVGCLIMTAFGMWLMKQLV